MKVTTLNFELTTRCNLKCPFCYRASLGKKIEKIDFDVELLNNIPIEDIKNYIICGSVGDAIFYPQLHEFLIKSYDRNPKLEIVISTNGTAHSKDWWIDLTKILKSKNSILVFAIDGLEDTHKINRIGANYKRVIENMQTFIDHGGRAIWQFVIFKHNQHQLSEARKLSEKMGCKKFVVRSSFEYDNNYERPDMISNLLTKSEIGSFTEEEIICRMDSGEVSILANGNVIPCCHAVARYDKRLGYKPSSLKDKHFNDIIKEGYVDRVWEKRYDLEFCQKCRGTNNFSIEKLIIEWLKHRALNKNRRNKLT